MDKITIIFFSRCENKEILKKIKIITECFQNFSYTIFLLAPVNSLSLDVVKLSNKVNHFPCDKKLTLFEKLRYSIPFVTSSHCLFASDDDPFLEIGLKALRNRFLNSSDIEGIILPYEFKPHGEKPELVFLPDLNTSNPYKRLIALQSYAAPNLLFYGVHQTSTVNLALQCVPSYLNNLPFTDCLLVYAMVLNSRYELLEETFGIYDYDGWNDPRLKIKKLNHFYKYNFLSYISDFIFSFTYLFFAINTVLKLGLKFHIGVITFLPIKLAITNVKHLLRLVLWKNM